MIYVVLYLCHYVPALLRFWFQTNLGREILASYLEIQRGRPFLPRSRVGHALRPMFMLWLVKIWQLISCRKFMQHLQTCLLWQLKLTEVCVNFYWFFWLRDASLVKVGNLILDGIVFVFHLAWCVRGSKVSSDSSLTLWLSWAVSRIVSLNNYRI